jgi:addiction module RelB/DinJ family antitoxin
VQLVSVDIVLYTGTMAHFTRTASIQARVVPSVKTASERILNMMGLNMSEAVELFLRRVIVDKRIPFEIVALDVVDLEPTAQLHVGKSAHYRSPAATTRPREAPNEKLIFSKRRGEI